MTRSLGNKEEATNIWTWKRQREAQKTSVLLFHVYSWKQVPFPLKAGSSDAAWTPGVSVMWTQKTITEGGHCPHATARAGNSARL